MKRLRLIAAAAAALYATAALAGGSFDQYPKVGSSGGSGVPAGPSFLTGSETIPMDTGLAGGVSPQTVIAPITALGNYGGTPRNYLDNAALNVTNTNGTSTVTGQINAAAAAAVNMAADRWLLSTNVASGAGRSAIVTSSPTPPTGFSNVMKVYRTSGALTQPICVHQAIPSANAVALQGKQLTLSFHAAALAGLAADNGNVISAVVYTGTGTDERYGSWTASPAITPAWTGIATAKNQSFTITTTFTRYATQVTIPATATEVGVALCFTPTATGAGATDGFAWTGAQLEVGSAASPFEFVRKQDDLVRAQQFFYKISEGAGPTPRAMCTVTTANTTMQCLLPLPQTLYASGTFTFANGFAVPTTTADTALTACTGFAVSALPAANVGQTEAVMAQCTSGGTTAAVGLALPLYDNGGSGSFTAWAGM